MNKNTVEIKTFEWHSRTDVGLVRQINEDRYLAEDTVNGSLFAVFDGMGGINGGELAAETAKKAVENYVKSEWIEDPRALLRDAVKEANEAVRAVFEHLPEGMKPGTTAVLVIIRGSAVFYAHVGDSRIYYAGDKKLIQLTKDHSFVQRLIDEGQITKTEARVHSRRNEITRAVGIKQEIEVEIAKIPIEPSDGECLLLCSDGLSGMLTDKEIENVISSNAETAEKADLLLQKAVEAGGEDNITLQCIRFFNTGNIPFQKENNIQTEELPKRFFSARHLMYIFVLLALFSVWLFIFPEEQNINRSTERCSLHLRKNSDMRFTSGNNVEVYSFFYNIEQDSFFSQTGKCELYFRFSEEVVIQGIE